MENQPPNPYHSKGWKDLPPWQQMLIKRTAWFFGGTLLFGILLGPTGALIWLFAWLMVGLFKVLGWTIRADHRERTTKEFDKSFFDELKDIEEKVRDAMPHIPKKKSNNPGPKFWDANGHPMKCIMCDAWTNKKGRYCNEHDE